MKVLIQTTEQITSSYYELDARESELGIRHNYRIVGKSKWNKDAQVPSSVTPAPGSPLPPPHPPPGKQAGCCGETEEGEMPPGQDLNRPVEASKLEKFRAGEAK